MLRLIERGMQLGRVLAQPATPPTLIGGLGRQQPLERRPVPEHPEVAQLVDHDVVDGAPAARFGNDLMSLIESGYGLAAAEM